MKSTVLTIGTFDGVHRGHREILRDVVARAKKLKLIPAAVTFSIPPRLYFFPSNEPSLLTTPIEKRELLESCGIKNVRILNFNRTLAQMSAKTFFEKYVVQLCGAKEVIVGYNFGFGRNREGDARFLEKMGVQYGVNIKIVPPIVFDSVPVSSGRIRQALREGSLSAANALLGSEFCVSGRVIIGQKLGLKIGFPTANLEIHQSKIVPQGVFAVLAILPDGKKLKGMANSGTRPTVNRGQHEKQVFEAHLFGFSGNLYGKSLKFRLIQKMREERKFKNLEDLSKQLENDRIMAKKILDDIT